MPVLLNKTFHAGKNVIQGEDLNAIVSAINSLSDDAISDFVTNIPTVGAGTLTAASIVSGIINRTGPTTAFTDTTDTAANIIAALPNAVVGQSFSLWIINQTAFVDTLAAGTGITFAGIAGTSPVIASNSTARFQITVTAVGSNPALTMYLTEVAYNAPNGYDPSTVLTQFGSGSATFSEEGNVVKLFTAGTTPASTAADIVVATYTLPANSFDATGRSIVLQAYGNLAANANNKTAKIIVGATTATIGSAVVGGTTVATTGVTAGNNVGWALTANVNKYGAANSNTQNYQTTGIIIGATHGGIGVAGTLTLTENAPIIIAVTLNNATTATDSSLWQFIATASN